MSAAQPSMFEMLMPFVFIMGVFWFLIIRPQSKRVKEHTTFLQNIKRGDEVITSSGILGRVDGMTDKIVTLEIAQGVKAKFLRKQVQALQSSLNDSPTAEVKNPAKV